MAGLPGLGKGRGRRIRVRDARRKRGAEFARRCEAYTQLKLRGEAPKALRWERLQDRQLLAHHGHRAACRPHHGLPAGAQDSLCSGPECPRCPSRRKVACVGDSITYGYLASSSAKNYPSQLGELSQLTRLCAACPDGRLARRGCGR